MTLFYNSLNKVGFKMYFFNKNSITCTRALGSLRPRLFEACIWQRGTHQLMRLCWLRHRTKETKSWVQILPDCGCFFSIKRKTQFVNFVHQVWNMFTVSCLQWTNFESVSVETFHALNILENLLLFYEMLRHWVWNILILE